MLSCTASRLPPIAEDPEVARGMPPLRASRSRIVPASRPNRASTWRIVVPAQSRRAAPASWIAPAALRRCFRHCPNDNAILVPFLSRSGKPHLQYNDSSEVPAIPAPVGSGERHR